MIKLRDLQYLVAIKEHRHLGRAAEACFVSQPTLSSQLKKLEEQLGLLLIERSRQSVMLTTAGQVVVEKAEVVLRSAEELEQTARTLTAPLEGDLHLGLIPTLAPYLLPHIMPVLSEALPDMQIYLHEEQTEVLLNQLQSGKLDMLILPWLGTMEGLTKAELFDEPLVLAMPEAHPLAEQQQVSLSQLKGEPILVLESGHCLREQSLGYCFTAGAEEDGRFRATSLETLRYMVAGGAGLTLMPALAVMNAKEAAGITYRPFTAPVPKRAIALVTRPQFPRTECLQQVNTALSKLGKQLIAELNEVR